MTDIDQIARDNANSALAKIDAHEQICAERQGHIIESLTELKHGMQGLYKRFWTASIAVIMALASVCGTLLYMVINGNR